MGTFQVNYNAGGVIDEVKKIKLLEQVDNIGNLENIENLQNVDNVQDVQNVNQVGLVGQVGDVNMVSEVGKINGFATKTQPFNYMEMYDVPALAQDFTFTLNLPAVDVEILAITLTCSGYGEDDHYDLFFNGQQWFENWYCSEIKEGLFLGTSTYVYAAPSNSQIDLIFKNDSGTSKKVWLGVRMLK